MVAIKLVRGVIRSDAKNWRLSIDGSKNPMYYSSLDRCLESYIEHRLRLSDASSVEKLLNFHKLVVKQLNSTLAPLKIKVTEVKNGD